MMFKRWRLSAAFPLVNAGVASILLFSLAACGGKDKPPANEGETSPETSANTDAPLSIADDNGLQLSAVWNTSALDAPVSDLALSGSGAGLLAVAYTNGNLQLFNLNAERVTEPVALDAALLAQGHVADFGGTTLTLFPGIGGDGIVKAYAFGDGLDAPVMLDLDVDQSGRALGICSLTPFDDSDGVMRLGYWTKDAETRLNTGRIVAVRESLVWLPEEPLETDTPITACTLTETGAQVMSGAAMDAAQLKRPDYHAILTLGQTGELFMTGGLLADPASADIKSVEMQSGITVDVPDAPIGIDALGMPRGGIYADGLVVVGGQSGDGSHRIVFMDAGDLTGGSLPIARPDASALPTR